MMSNNFSQSPIPPPSLSDVLSECESYRECGSKDQSADVSSSNSLIHPAALSQSVWETLSSFDQADHALYVLLSIGKLSIPPYRVIVRYQFDYIHFIALGHRRYKICVRKL